jgi:Protein of unknown function (DUF3592)
MWTMAHTGAVFLGFCGLLAAVTGVLQLAQSRSARRWPGVPATILSSAVRREHSADSQLDDDRRAEVTYHLELSYAYEVGGRRYVGEDLGIHGNQLLGDGADELAAYPAGRTVTAYYDPARPETAVLVRRVPWLMSFVLIGVGGFFACVGLAVALGILQPK